MFNANNSNVLFYCKSEVLHKLLVELLKDCWEPHKSCLGTAFNSQNSSWEPLP